MDNPTEPDGDSSGLTDTAFAADALSEEDAQRCQLYVELGISFPASCSISEKIPDLESADLFLRDDECLTRLTCDGESEEGVFIVRQETCSDCICHAFDTYDCPPKIERIEEEQTIVSCYLPNRDKLRNLIDDLQGVSDRVRLLKIVEIDQNVEGETSRSLTFDLTELTETQRETLEVAVTNGYYDEPKDISLDALAAQLDVSKSALSRRLKRAEANLVSQVIRTD